MRELKSRGFDNIFQLGAGTSSYADLGAADAGSVAVAVSLMGKLSLEETRALVSVADLFVGVDSGLLHAAAAFRELAVGIWGALSLQYLFAESESRGFVVSTVGCRGCHHRVPRLHHTTGCPHDIRCLKNLKVESVLGACLEKFSAAKC